MSSHLSLSGRRKKGGSLSFSSFLPERTQFDQHNNLIAAMGAVDPAVAKGRDRGKLKYGKWISWIFFGGEFEPAEN
jgi:hypothetical protein